MPTLDLAPIGNCSIASLIDRQGRHVWYCFPRLDGDPIFNALVGGEAPQAGFMDVALRDQVESRQRYLPNTAVLETTLTDKNGASVRIIDVAPRFRHYGRTFKPPMLLRRIEPGQGRPRITRSVAPDLRLWRAARRGVAFGSNHIRFIDEEQTLRLTTDAPISYIMGETEFAPGAAGQPLLRPRRAAERQCRHAGAILHHADDELLVRLGARPRRAVRLAGSRHPRRHHAEAVHL